MKLTKAKRIKYFKFLGLTYNKDGILALQRKYFVDSSEHDGKYGNKTDILLRHVYNVSKNCTTFKPEEFRCPCGRCTGYPTQMRARELRHVQRIRDHYGRSMTVTSGLRCEHQNNRVGGSKDSRHLKGLAVDFYMRGVTDTLAHRISAIRYIRTLPNHRYSYGNGYNSYGRSVYVPSMGTAIHTDVR